MLLFSANAEPFFGPFFSPRERNSVDVVMGVKPPFTNRYNLITTEENLFHNFSNSFSAPLGNYSIIKWPNLKRYKLWGSLRDAMEYIEDINKKPERKGYSLRYFLNPPYQKTFFNNLPPEPKPWESFHFLVYGDTREASPYSEGKQYLQKDSIFVETVNFIKNFIQKLPEKDKPILHLHTGDFVYSGGVAVEWIEVLEELNKIIKNKYFAAAIGNHEIYSKSIISNILKNLPITAKYPSIPHFGNLFYFEEPKTEKMEYFKHVKGTQRWFDLGCVRFIHLPLIHEEVKGRHYRSEALYKSIFEPGHAFNPEVITQFITYLKNANEERNAGAIKFIIVYGHIPLVTSPDYQTPHKGLFEIPELQPDIKDKLAEASSRIQEAFLSYQPDAYFCGHNHLYDRVTWNNIPMITIGIGTYLAEGIKITTQISGKEMSKTGKFIAKGKTDRFIGFLDCIVTPEENKITCQLIGIPPKKNLTIFPAGEITGNSFDHFEIETSELRKRKFKEQQERKQKIKQEEPEFEVVYRSNHKPTKSIQKRAQNR